MSMVLQLSFGIVWVIVCMLRDMLLVFANAVASPLQEACFLIAQRQHMGFDFSLSPSFNASHNFERLDWCGRCEVWILCISIVCCSSQKTRMSRRAEKHEETEKPNRLFVCHLLCRQVWFLSMCLFCLEEKIQETVLSITGAYWWIEKAGVFEVLVG